MSLKTAGGNDQQKRANDLNKLFNTKVKGGFKIVADLLKKLPDDITQAEVLEQAGFDLSGIAKQGNGKYTQEYTLYSGEVVPFIEMHIPYDELDNLVVEDEINGRNQERLSEESLQNIIATLDQNQFIPVFGSIREDGRINLGDGSRRKAAAKHLKTGLKALVSTKPISDSDLRILAMQIQSVKEHTLYEKGLKWLALESDGIEGKKIAKLAGVSEATVTRGKKAARVPKQLLAPIKNLDAIASLEWDYLSILKENITATHAAKDNSFDYAFDDFVLGALGEFVAHSLEAAEVIKLYKTHEKKCEETTTEDKNVAVEQQVNTGKVRLAEGDGKVFLDRKVTAKGDTSYFVGRLPEETRNEIDEFISKKITEYVNSQSSK